MRITNIYMANGVLYGIQDNLSKLARSQEQLATSKRLLRLSDDPTVIDQFMSIKATLSYNEQYKKNIDDGISYLDMSDSVMGALGDILKTAKDLTLQAANSTYNAEDRKVTAQQIDKLIDQVVDLANTTVGDKYIFAGTKNSTPPFSRDPATGVITYSGDLNAIMREVLAGTDYRIDQQAISTTPGSPGVFGEGTLTGAGTYTVGDGIFQVLKDLKDRLENNQVDDLQTSISEIDRVSDGILQKRTAVGARQRHFDLLSEQLLDQEVKLIENLTNVEGADMAKLSIQLAQQKLAYQASLASGANILNTSLLNFLK